MSKQDVIRDLGYAIRTRDWPMVETLYAKLLSATPGAPSPEILEQANTIYGIYPKKVGKPYAIRCIIKQVKDHGFALVLENTRRFAEAVKDMESKFIPNPSTFFNQQRFMDDCSTWNSGKTYDDTMAELKARRDEMHKRYRFDTNSFHGGELVPNWKYYAKEHEEYVLLCRKIASLK